MPERVKLSRISVDQGDNLRRNFAKFDFPGGEAGKTYKLTTFLQREVFPSAGHQRRPKRPLMTPVGLKLKTPPKSITFQPSFSRRTWTVR